RLAARVQRLHGVARARQRGTGFELYLRESRDRTGAWDLARRRDRHRVRVGSGSRDHGGRRAARHRPPGRQSFGLRSSDRALRGACMRRAEGSTVAIDWPEPADKVSARKGRSPMAVSYENLPGAGSASRGVDHPNVRDLRVPGPLDATLPPTPIRELLAASGATVYVLATDGNFISTIRRAAEQHPLFVVESWPELIEAVETGRCGIALLDAALLGGRVSQCVARLAVYHDRLVTLVAADRTAAQEYVGLLSGGRIHRLLIKPTAVGAARLLIESATARRLQLRDESKNASAPG